MASRSFIVGDAGGTNTQWRVVHEGSIQQFKTIGFNAYTHDIEDLKTDVLDRFGHLIMRNIPLYFYAAGIDTPEQAKQTTDALSGIFGPQTFVSNDLLGVARSLYGKDAGNTCILGTGSNACYYDGSTVSKVSASLGYVLGDEGSGAYLGKKLLTGVFRKHLSQDVIQAFQNIFHLSPHQAIQQIYHQPQPNHFLASFAPFIHDHRGYPDIYSIVYSSFEDFFDAFFRKSEHLESPFSFSGSIAYHFSDILRQVAIERGYEIQIIVESPISGLVLYHQRYD